MGAKAIAVLSADNGKLNAGGRGKWRESSESLPAADGRMVRRYGELR